MGDDIYSVNAVQGSRDSMTYPVTWTTIRDTAWLNDGYISTPGKAFYENHTFSVTRINNFAGMDMLILMPDGGWYNCERWDGVPTRWIDNNASLIVYSVNQTRTRVSFEAFSCGMDREIIIYVNCRAIEEVGIPGTFVMVNMTVNLNPRSNTIRFFTPDGSIKVSETQGINVEDDRNVSFAIRNITVTPEKS